MRKGQISPYMQTANYFKAKYASEWNEVISKFKAEKPVEPAKDAGQTVSVVP